MRNKMPGWITVGIAGLAGTGGLGFAAFRMASGHTWTAGTYVALHGVVRRDGPRGCLEAGSELQAWEADTPGPGGVSLSVTTTYGECTWNCSGRSCTRFTRGPTGRRRT